MIQNQVLRDKCIRLGEDGLGVGLENIPTDSDA